MGPLDGIRVIEIASLAPAPFGCMVLSDLGADVLRVDRPDRAGRQALPPVDPLARGRRAVEEPGQSPRPVVGVEPVVLLDRDPGQFAALARQLVRHPGVLLLALKQLIPSGAPLLTADNLVIRHRVLSPSRVPFVSSSFAPSARAPTSTQR